MHSLLLFLALLSTVYAIPAPPHSPPHSSQEYERLSSSPSLTGSRQFGRSRFSMESLVMNTPSQHSSFESMRRSSSIDVFKAITKQALLLSTFFSSRYKLTGEVLGIEWNGLVYEAEWLLKNRSVAVKIGYFDTSDRDSIMFTEISVWEAIKNRVDGIAVHVETGFEPAKNLFYIITEIMYDGAEARDYKEYLSGHVLDVSKATNHLLQLAATLHNLHMKSVYHGNLRLDALLITSSNKLLLTDFSNAGFIPESQIVLKDLGTIFYKSPQLIAKQPNLPPSVNPIKSDTYSLGIIYFIQLFGYKRFVNEFVLKSGSDICHRLNAFILDFKWAKAGLARDQKMLLRGMLNVDEDKRWTARVVMRFITLASEDMPKPRTKESVPNKSIMKRLQDGLLSMFFNNSLVKDRNK